MSVFMLASPSVPHHQDIRPTRLTLRRGRLPLTESSLTPPRASSSASAAALFLSGIYRLKAPRRQEKLFADFARARRTLDRLGG